MARYIETPNLHLRKPDVTDPDKTLGYWGEDLNFSLDVLDTQIWNSVGDVSTLTLPVTNLTAAVNMLDGFRPDYVLLAGKLGGQTVYGGTATGQTLVLKNNSVDNTGITVGASGVGINTIPSWLLHVKGPDLTDAFQVKELAAFETVNTSAPSTDRLKITARSGDDGTFTDYTLSLGNAGITIDSAGNIYLGKYTDGGDFDTRDDVITIARASAGIASSYVSINAKNGIYLYGPTLIPGTGGNSTTRIGSSAVASSTNSIAIGQNSTASTGSNNIAIGYLSQATGSTGGAVAIGQSVASARNSIAIKGTASGTESTALGHNSSATHVGSTAIGVDATTTENNQIRLGTASETVSIPGAIQSADYKSSDGSSGITKTITIEYEYNQQAYQETFTFKNGLLTAHTSV